MQMTREIQAAVGLLFRNGYTIFSEPPTVELVTTVGIEGCNMSGAVLKINGGDARTVKPGTKIALRGKLSQQ